MPRSPFDRLMRDAGIQALNNMLGEAASYHPPANSIAGVDAVVSSLTVRVARFEQEYDEAEDQKRISRARIYVRTDLTTPEARGRFKLTESDEEYAVISTKLVAGEWQCECERGEMIGALNRASQR